MPTGVIFILVQGGRLILAEGGNFTWLKGSTRAGFSSSKARENAHPDSDIDLLILVDTDDIPEKETDELKSSFYDIVLDSGIIINPNLLLLEK